MDFYELLEYLDLDEAADFQYFEAMADLLESEDYIEMEAMYQLFEGADKTMISELIQDYFEDILEGLPESSGEIYSLLHQIKISLIGMVSHIEDDSALRRFTDEFFKFKNWYSSESDVELSPVGGGVPLHQNVRDAITTARLEKLGGDKYDYNFEEALDYELDSYTMSFADLMSVEEDDESSIIFDPEEGEPGEVE